MPTPLFCANVFPSKHKTVTEVNASMGPECPQHSAHSRSRTPQIHRSHILLYCTTKGAWRNRTIKVLEAQGNRATIVQSSDHLSDVQLLRVLRQQMVVNYQHFEAELLKPRRLSLPRILFRGDSSERRYVPFCVSPEKNTLMQSPPVDRLDLANFYVPLSWKNIAGLISPLWRCGHFHKIPLNDLPCPTVIGRSERDSEDFLLLS